MSKYGTIPRSGSAPPSVEPSSPFDPISGVHERGMSSTTLATHRPWRELANPRALSLPSDFADAFRRWRYNLHYFAANYAAVVLLAVFLSLLWWPVSQLVFLACAAAWLLLFFLRGGAGEPPLVLCGRAVGEGVVLAALSALTVVVMLVAGPAVNVLASLLVGLAVVLLHAVLHGDVVRWHALGLPVPPY